jgi:lysophospholipase L1-like esterase
MRKSLTLFILSLTLIFCPALFAVITNVTGEHIDPTKDFGQNASYKLSANTTFGWKTGTQSGDIDLNGHTLTIETGGGNRTVLSGAISGKGSIQWRGGAVPQVAPSLLAGDKPNTFSGPLIFTKGVLDLAKPAGVDAIPQDLIIGDQDNAMIRLNNPDQINDASNITLAGKGISEINLQGHNEKFASLTLQTHAIITMGQTPASLSIGDSSAAKWDLTKTLTIQAFKPKLDKLSFSNNNKGLTQQQLTRIGFANPADMPLGLYSAKISSNGELTPDSSVKPNNPPFELSENATAHRAKLYEITGLANLCGADSPLKNNMTIDFFGDSITWLNGYITTIDKAIKTSNATRDKKIKLINRGINGGGVLQIRDGAKEGAFPGSRPQDSFAKLIAADKADLAVLYIGINDVWWRKTTKDVFQKALEDIIASAKARNMPLVIATLSVHGELPDGKNSDDPKIDQYADITRKVAKDTGTTLVDLRAAYIAYLQNHNAQLRIDGTLYSKPTGILTYDGVHPNTKGTAFLADLITDGITRALSPEKTPTKTPN